MKGGKQIFDGIFCSGDSVRGISLPTSAGGREQGDNCTQARVPGEECKPLIKHSFLVGFIPIPQSPGSRGAAAPHAGQPGEPAAIGASGWLQTRPNYGPRQQVRQPRPLRLVRHEEARPRGC